MSALFELMSLKGRTACVTGAAGNLGRMIVEVLTELGASVAVVDINQGACQSVADDMAARFGSRVVPLSADLADDSMVHALPSRVADALGGLDILVNNAGFVGTSDLPGWVTDFPRQTTQTWRKAFEVNLTAPFTLCREARQYLRASGKGCIINVGSIYGAYGPDLGLYEDTGMGNPAGYAASKGGLIQLTRWLATVLAPEVRVNCLSPGGVFRNQPPTFVKRYEARTPLGRMAVEEDFKGVIAWLASDMSAYVTGQNIFVDGGFGVW